MVIKSLLLSALMSLAVGAVPLASEKNSVSPAAVEYAWESVTDVTSLSNGDVIAIGNGSYYMKDSDSDIGTGGYATQNVGSYNFVDGSVNIPFNGGSFKLEAHATNADNYRIVSTLDDSRAIGMSSSSANNMELKATHKTDDFYWVFRSTSTGKISIKHSEFGRYISKSDTKNENGFRAYSDKERYVSLFKKVEVAERHIVSISASGYEAIQAYPGETIDFSLVVITGTYDVGGERTVTSDCTFSPTVASSSIGTQTITVTYNGDDNPATTFNITVIPKPVAISYEKVTNISEIDVGSSVIFGENSAENVTGSFGTKGLSGVKATFGTNNVEFYEDDGVNILTIEQGSTSNTYSFKTSIENKYLSLNTKSGDMVLSSTKNESSSWKISFSDNVALIENCSASYFIRYSSSVSEFRVAGISSGNPLPSMYRYNGGGEHVVLSETSHSVFEQDEFTLTAEAKLFVASSWAFTSNNSNVQLTQDGASCKIKGLIPGTSIVTVTANGTYSADCLVTVEEVTYDVLTGDTYCFLSNNNRFYMSQSLGAVENLDLTNPANLFTFVRAYKGNNSYYIKTSSNNYVQYSESGSKLGLSMTPSSYWTVSKNTDGTYTWETKGKVLSLFTKTSNEHFWYLFDNPTEEQSHNRLVGSLTYVSMGYNGSPIKTNYDLGDKFDPTGITSYFVRYKTEEQEFIDSPFSGEITWDELEPGNVASGSALVNGTLRTIEVTGITVSTYSPKELVLDTSATLTSYYPGQEVDLTGLIAKVKYEDDSSNVKYRDLTNDQLEYMPNRVSSETSEITVKVKENGLSAAFSITVTEPVIRTTNKLAIGDHIVIAQMSYNPEGILGGIELTMNGSNVAIGQEYDYIPDGTTTYEVLAGTKSDTYAFKNVVSGKFLQKDGTSLMERSNTISDNASFEYIYNRNDRISYLYIDDAYVYFNTDAQKFRIDSNFDPDYIALDIYSFATTSSVQSISANSETTETEFEVNDKFTWTNLVVTANYGNGVSNTLPVGSFSITQPDMSIPGTKLITVDYFGKKSSYTIVVKNKEEVITLTDLRLENVKDTYLVGDNPVYTAIAVYSDESELDVTELTTYEFYSLTPSTGQRTCTVTYKEKGQQTKQAQFKYVVVDVPAIDDVTIKQTDIGDATKGSTYQIVISSVNGETIPETGEEQENAIHKFKFTSSNESIATVDSEGSVTIRGLGEVFIDVQARKGSGSTRLRIFAPGKTTSIEVAETSISIVEGKGYQIIATINPEKARDEILRYSAENPSIAIVSEDGFISGVSKGKTKVYVISEDGSIKVAIDVTVEAAPIPPTPSTSETTIEPSTSETPISTSGGGSTSEGPGPVPVDPNKNIGLIVALVIIGTVVVAGGVVSIVIFAGKKKK